MTTSFLDSFAFHRASKIRPGARFARVIFASPRGLGVAMLGLVRNSCRRTGSHGLYPEATWGQIDRRASRWWKDRKNRGEIRLLLHHPVTGILFSRIRTHLAGSAAKAGANSRMQHNGLLFARGSSGWHKLLPAPALTTRDLGEL